MTDQNLPHPEATGPEAAESGGRTSPLDVWSLAGFAGLVLLALVPVAYGKFDGVRLLPWGRPILGFHLGFFDHAYPKEPLLWSGMVLLLVWAAGRGLFRPGSGKGLRVLPFYLCALAAGWLFSPWPQLGLPRFAEDAALALFAILASAAIRRPAVREHAPEFLALAFLPAAAISILTQSGGIVFAAPAGNPNVAANLFLLPALVSAGSSLSARAEGDFRRFLLRAVACLVFAITLVASRSEGALIALVAGVAFLAWRIGPKPDASIAFAGIAVAMVLAFLLAGRVAGGSNPGKVLQASTIGTRILLWESAGRAFETSPARLIAGFGPGSSPCALALRPAPGLPCNRWAAESETHPHSEPIRTLFESGIAGVAALAFLVFPLLGRFSQGSALAAGVQAGVAALLVSGAGCVPLGEPANRAILFLSIGALAGLRAAARGETPPQAGLARGFSLATAAGALWVLLVPGKFLAEREMSAAAAARAAKRPESALPMLARAAARGTPLLAFRARMTSAEIRLGGPRGTASALAEIQAARRILPGFGPADRHEAALRLQLGDEPGALETISVRLERRPADALAWDLAGAACQSLGRKGDPRASPLFRILVESLRKASVAIPAAPSLRIVLATFEWPMGEREAALRSLSEAERLAGVRLARDRTDPDGIDVLRKAAALRAQWTPPKKPRP